MGEYAAYGRTPKDAHGFRCRDGGVRRYSTRSDNCCSCRRRPGAAYATGSRSSGSNRRWPTTRGGIIIGGRRRGRSNCGTTSSDDGLDGRSAVARRSGACLSARRNNGTLRQTSGPARKRNSVDARFTTERARDPTGADSSSYAYEADRGEPLPPARC